MKLTLTVPPISMFPKSLNAKVAQRMAVWCAMLGFLAVLYGAIEAIEVWKLAAFSRDAQRATARADRALPVAARPTSP